MPKPLSNWRPEAMKLDAESEGALSRLAVGITLAISTLALLFAAIPSFLH